MGATTIARQSLVIAVVMFFGAIFVLKTVELHKKKSHHKHNPVDMMAIKKNDDQVSSTVPTLPLTQAPPSTPSLQTTQATQGKTQIVAPQPKILCMVLTSFDNNATGAKAVKETWGGKCDHLLFFSSAPDKQIGSIVLDHVEDGPTWAWEKTRRAFEYAWTHHGNDADWFLKADDDTFVIVDNLKEFVKNFQANQSFYVGHQYGADPLNDKGFMYGGSGYLLSRKALERFVKEAATNGTICEPAVANPRPNHNGDEDVEMGRCLRNIGGVTWVNPRDSEGRWRFLQLSPEYHAARNDLPESKAPECCLDTVLSFHGVQPQMQYLLDYLLYHVRIGDFRTK